MNHDKNEPPRAKRNISWYARPPTLACEHVFELLTQEGGLHFIGCKKCGGRQNESPHDRQKDGHLDDSPPTLTMMRRDLELEMALLDELINFSAFGPHPVLLNVEFIDVHEVLCLVVKICRKDLELKQMKVLLDLRATNHGAQADSLRLQQVMWQLLRNAITFSPQGSRISISTFNTPSGQITIEFVDQGIGIEPERLPYLFDASRRAEPSKGQFPGGLALGLFIAKGLAEAQQGSLSAESKGRGHGATFRLTLEGLHPSHAPTLGSKPAASFNSSDASVSGSPDDKQAPPLLPTS